ncbi:MAG: altronate dehydratase, partial [Acutalibacteraceae bacterium]
TPQPLSALIVGFKCGGSDGFSGITANPLCGKLSESLTNEGAGVILTEVPEMFGAEQYLFDRCKDKTVFEKAVNMINSFKDYFISHNQPVYENPSPGNKEGGITTLEEKSLGCITKGGQCAVTDVLEMYAECTSKGLSLLNGPGNDIVSVTNLACSGAVMVLFTTGRGTPLGGPVPTLKISTNNDLYKRKTHWIDYNAGVLLTDGSFQNSLDELEQLVIETACGKKTANEINGCEQIAVFKDGVTL